MKFWAMVLMALVVCGCSTGMWGWHRGATPSHLGAASRETIMVNLDSGFTKEERASIEGALNEWNRAFNGQVTLRVGKEFKGLEEGSKLLEDMRKKGEGWIIVRVSSDDELAAGASENALAFAGRGIMVVIWDRIGTRDLKTILMHEMGHLFGVSHMRSPSLMNAYYGRGQYSCIDKLTVSEVAAVRGLKLDEMNYCITPGFE